MLYDGGEITEPTNYADTHTAAFEPHLWLADPPCQMTNLAR